MEPILPSEMARLVFGYLEQENCKEASRIFLETSPNLTECYQATKNGKKFSVKFHGSTLTDILDTYCSASMLLQEKLSTIEDKETIKQASFIEQLKFIMDERFQRFFVNISVPHQNTSPTPGNSSIISSSIRTRKYVSPNDREKKEKRQQKANLFAADKHQEETKNGNYRTVETTSLDQLPGHSKNSIKSPRKYSNSDTTDSRLVEAPRIIPASEIAVMENLQTQMTATSTLPEIQTTIIQPSSTTGYQSSSYSTVTDTKEGFCCTTTGAQTSPINFNEYEYPNESILNLGLLSTELCHQPKIHEKIAENINNDYHRDKSNFDTQSDCNASINTQLNDIFAKIANKTDKDPVFEEIIHRIMVPEDREESPDEEDQVVEISDKLEKEKNSDVNAVQTIEKPNERVIETRTLDDENAAAILSIINANATNESKASEENKSLNSDNSRKEETLNTQKDKPALVKKTKVPRGPKPSTKKRDPPLDPPANMKILEMPGLIVMERTSNTKSAQCITSSATEPVSRVIPIAPKNTIITSQPVITRPLYLKAMNLKVVTPLSPSQNNSPVRLLREIVSKPHPTLVTAVESQISKNTVKVSESVTLYGSENSTRAIIPANPISPVHIENLLNAPESSFSLSPYLKFDRPSEKAQVEAEEKDEVVEAASTSTTHCTTIIKHTPKSLLKSRQNNHRLSLSTPRKRINHVRALDFNTPTKGLNSSRRMSDANSSKRFTPSTSSLSKSSFRTSLFKSPNYPGSLSGKKTKSPVKVNRSPLCKIPIATRGLEPKLAGGWEKYTGVGLIIESKSPQSNSSFSSPEKKSTNSSPKTVNTVDKKCWDADLRASVVIVDEPVETKVETRKRRTANAKARKEAHLATDATANKQKEGDDNNQDKPETPAIKKSSPVEEQTSPSTDTVTQDTKNVTKKYVKLKTLTTTVARKEPEKPKDYQHISPELSSTSRVFSKINAPGTLPNLNELETPMKFDSNFGIPPTPQLTSPNHSNTTRFSQTTDDSRKIQGFVLTPEFPPTPNIAITPKQLSNSIIDGSKDEKFAGCSSYYQPSGEINGGKPMKSTNEIIEKSGVIETSAMISSTPITPVDTITKMSISGSTIEVSYQQKSATNVTNKMEITQFEVIKDNLSREDAFKELKMSSSKDKTSSDIQHDNHTSIDKTETSSLMSHNKSLDTSGTTADDSSDSDSDSDSSSSSSSSSNSSCSTCMNDTNTSSRVSTVKKSKKTPITTDNNTLNKFSQLFGEQKSDLTGITKENSSLESAEKNFDTKFRENNEASPVKVFPIIKTDEMLKNADIETPAKDETLVEADIGETPSSSKAGVESLTNLSSKISALTKEGSKTSFQGTQVKITKPTIVSVEKIPPSDPRILNLGKAPVQKKFSLRDPTQDAIFSAELEEKRLRMISKLTAPTKPPAKKAPKKGNNSVKKQLKREDEKLPEAPVTKAKTKARISRVPVKNQLVATPDGPSSETQKSTTIPKTEKTISISVVATRKSLRTAERNAKRGLSEPRDKSNVSKKIEPERKAQSSREPSANDDTIIDRDILKLNETVNNSQSLETKVNDPEVAKNESKEKIENTEVVEQNKNLTVKDEEKKTSETIKSKVEMVKRDLFSDDEQSLDQRTTRSRTRKTSETQKCENSTESHDNLDVLECLQLIPANKSTEEQEINEETDAYEHMEISFVYDDTVPTKKRRRKYSSSELECRIQVEGEDGEDVTKLLTAPPYEEIFNMSPVRKRKPPTGQAKSRVVKEKVVPTIVRKRKAPIKLRNTKSVVSTVESQPLATSSPLQDNHPTKTADIDKQVSVIIQKMDPNKVGVKTNKRKLSHTKDNEDNQLDNKKLRAALDPEALLKEMDFNEFLQEIHGPSENLHD